MTDQKRPILIIKGKRGSKVLTLESAVKPSLNVNNKDSVIPKDKKKQKVKEVLQPAKVKQEPPKPLTKEEKAARHVAKLETAVNMLVALCPQLFNVESPKPLKVGIGKDVRRLIRDKGLDIPNNQISTGLMAYTQAEAYQRALSEGGLRFGLDGQPCGEVTDEQKVRAKRKLNEL